MNDAHFDFEKRGPQFFSFPKFGLVEIAVEEEDSTNENLFSESVGEEPVVKEGLSYRKLGS